MISGSTCKRDTVSQSKILMLKEAKILTLSVISVKVDFSCHHLE